jgi:N-acetylgalactosamine kinase
VKGHRVAYGKLKQRFAEIYPGSRTPEGCRSPGRVNLIGEHTDYNGLPVLPMTLDREIRIAFSPAPESRVTLRNTDPGYPERSFINGPGLAPSPPGSWENYCKAAVQSINRHFGMDSFPGMSLLVDSDLPAGAGLSSSSSLVVACALAYLKVTGRDLDRDISRLELAELLAEGEHFVGTRGGGMDQTVILNGEPDHACKIDFFPIRVEPTPLPPGCDIVICDSLVHVEKSGAALVRYNTGPRLCALACALVEKEAQQRFCEDIELARLGDLWFSDLCLTFREAEEVCLRAVPEDTMTLAEAGRRLSLTPEAVRKNWLGDLPEPDGGFDLRARLRHQFSEYQRVEAARDALNDGDTATFGRLMNESHESCARDFRISSPELDALVAAAREAGAIGARLTGAGFGGATVNLVPSDQTGAFIEEVTRSYYRDFKKTGGEAPIMIAQSGKGAGWC